MSQDDDMIYAEKMHSEKENIDYDVIILGAGMAGLAMAQSLAESDLSVCLMEHHDLNSKLSLVPRYESRVSALTEASYHFLKNMGVWVSADVDRICAYERMEVWDAEGTGRIKFHAWDVGYTHLGWIAENTVITAGLLAQLKTGKVTLLDNTQVLGIEKSRSSVSVLCENKSAITGRLLVAADGADSRVRKWAGIPITQKDCLHHAVVCNVQTFASHQHCAWQVFLESGPLAFLPLPGTTDDAGNKVHHSSIVWSIKPEKAKQVMAMDDQAFCHALTQAGEGCTGKVLQASKRMCIPLSQRYASVYVKDRVALIGDAAHTIHPLAGQGVNLGFMDAAVLTEEVLRAAARGDDWGSEHILNRYQRRRQGHNMMMLAAMDGFQQLFNQDALPFRWLRNAGMQLLGKHTLIKKQMIRQAMGLSGDIPEIMKAAE